MAVYMHSQYDVIQGKYWVRVVTRYMCMYFESLLQLMIRVWLWSHPSQASSGG